MARVLRTPQSQADLEAILEGLEEKSPKAADRGRPGSASREWVSRCLGEEEFDPWQIGAVL